MSEPNQIKKKYLAPEVVSYFDDQIDAVEGQLSQEALDRQSGDQASVNEAKAYANQKISDLVGGAPDILDTLKEISDALGNDANLASTLSGQIAGVQSGLASEISRATAAEAQALSDAKAYADGIVATEASSRSSGDTNTLNSAKAYTDAAVANVVSKSYVDSADTALSNRISPLESRSMYGNSFIFNDVIPGATPGDQPGSEDPSALKRDGWYFKNSTAGQGIGWYFYDKNTTQSGNIVKTAFSAFAVMTFDSVAALGAKPIIGIYSYPTGSGDAVPGFYHSKWVYQLSTSNLNSLSAGKKVLLYIGSDPSIHPELQHIQLDFIAASSAGPRLDSEVIGFASFLSDSNTAVNKVQWMVESLGVDSSAYKMKTQLRIRYAQKSSVDSEIARAQAAESVLTTSVNNEIAARQSGDSSTLSSAKAYTDTKHLEQKSYIDSADALKVSKAGDSMTGSLAINNGSTVNPALDVTGKIVINDTQDGKVFEFDPGLASFNVAYEQYPTAGVQIQPGLINAYSLSEDLTQSLANTTLEPGAVSIYGEGTTPAMASEPHHATTKKYVDDQISGQAALISQESSDRASADSALEDRIVALETAPPGMIAHKMSPITVSASELSYIDCQHQAKEMSLHVFVGRLAVHEGVDYTVSVVGGKTRITWAGSLVNPSGVESIELGDRVYISYMR